MQIHSKDVAAAVKPLVWVDSQGRVQTEAPSSLFSLGVVDFVKVLDFLFYRRHVRRAEDDEQRNDRFEEEDEEEDEEEADPGGVATPKKTCVYDPTKWQHSYWHRTYVLSDKCKNRQSQAGKLFRRRFRLPWETFRKLVIDIREEDWFEGRYEGKTAIGLPGIPIDLYVLGALRYLGRGWTFDDIAESTGVSEESHRVFLKLFCKKCREHLYPKWVKWPSTDEEIKSSMNEFSMAGTWHFYYTFL